MGIAVETSTRFARINRAACTSSFSPGTCAWFPLRPCAALAKSLLGVLLFSVAAAVPTQAATEEPDPVQTTLDRVEKMTFAQQQVWLKALEARALRAAELMPDRGEALREKWEIRVGLHQKNVTWETLREVLEAADRREKAAAPPKSPEPPAVVKPAPKAKVAPVVPTPVVVTPEPKVVEVLKPVVVPEGKIDEPKIEPPNPATVAVPPRETHAPATNHEAVENSDEVEINVDELAARIAGCNLAIRALESDLTEKEVWNAARIGPSLDRLKILAVRRGDLNLFRDALSEQRQGAVGRLDTLKTAVSRLGARIFEAREQVKGSEFAGTEDERAAELERLDDFSRRLAEAAGK